MWHVSVGDRSSVSTETTERIRPAASARVIIMRSAILAMPWPKCGQSPVSEEPKVEADGVVGLKDTDACSTGYCSFRSTSCGD